ncbi:type I restriction endonuclease subunit R [Deinococcus sp. Arct2-2]|uniref:type I restriction endonuclease subunit R n=1 Tax=Deinococcus sp. Arct2-2 TaxID=2568653 RepID=UPI0010A49364|nr:HsdR family type I site-specific deoxyribonuclease [Deinococcus sp. Arct2-2]THF70706.1 type I restriction endonuclease subunit R [Deinococcus sp. Arct2-2]
MTTSHGPEYNEVEFPLMGQLSGLGWDILLGDTFVPALTERESFKETLLMGRLRAAVRRINLPHCPWLDDSHVTEALSAFTRLPAGVNGLMAVNAHLTGLLLDGVQVTGPDGKGHTVRFLDFRNPANNDLLAVNQFRVDPPGYTGGPGFIIPDLVLFVNGLPLVVVECKSPDVTSPMEKAVGDLLMYQNLRGSTEPEGVERFFHTVQLLVGTNFYGAVLGTVGAPMEAFLTWKDTYPFTREQVQTTLGKPKLHPQQVLTAGVLNPATLLDLLENFTLTDAGGKRVARYQQYRAVRRALTRLQTGETRLLGAEHDKRGGIVWHTQGSGKSLTMMFLVRAIRTVPELRPFKIVVVTDRRDLEKQLSSTARVAGEPLTVAKGVKALNSALAQPGPGFVFGMVQKLRGQTGEDFDPQQAVLNPSEKILVLVDEAHRSHTNTQHAHLRAALPNAALIGFTGTPIIQGQQKKTQDIFGPIIDQYTILESQQDKATVPILYEGRSVKAFLKDGQSLDGLFDVFFDELDDAARKKLQEKYGTLGELLNSPKLIALKAEDMLLHYASQVLPNGFKAQVVAHSREAAVEYHRAFLKAQVNLVDELKNLPPSFLSLSPDKLGNLPERTRSLVLAHPYRERLSKLEFAPVISDGGKSDPADWAQWTDSTKQEGRIGEGGQFKDPAHPLSILIVKSMLLTGFDAPVEQALYLDRNIRNHELLQAIARVNRTAPHKTHGLVVDYYGVGHHLAQALSDYTQTDVAGAMNSIKDTLPVLETAHHDVRRIFTEAGIGLENREDAVNHLIDPKLRAEFKVRLSAFLNALDIVLPRPEALRYVQDAALLGRIADTARQVYAEGETDSPLGGGEKVRALIAQYVDASGIQVKVPRIEVLDPNFRQEVGGFTSKRTQAAAMEHAARLFINTRIGDDPVYYRKLSERLEELLKLHAQHWDALVEALLAFFEAMQAGRPADTTGLNPHTEAPFFSLLLEAQPEKPEDLTGAQGQRLIQGTVHIVQALRQRTAIPDFWRNAVQQGKVRGWLASYLDDQGLIPFSTCEAVADELMNLARRLHLRWVTPG